MKKRIFAVCIILIALVLVSTVPVSAKGPKKMLVHFDTCYATFMETGSGLVHEWRSNCPAYAGETSLHIVFKPTIKFPVPDCDGEDYLGMILNWSNAPGKYTEHGDDDANLTDFLPYGITYTVCFYEW
jgi:hypothetical protein